MHAIVDTCKCQNQKAVYQNILYLYLFPYIVVMAGNILKKVYNQAAFMIIPSSNSNIKIQLSSQDTMANISHRYSI